MTSLRSPLRVTTVGSCRIANPLRLLARRGDAILANGHVYGYTHSVAEALQVFDHWDGLEIPPDLVPYLSGTRVEHPKAGREAADVVVVEISSLKRLQCGDWLVQLNYFAERLRGTPSLKACFDAAPDAAHRDARILALLREPDFATLSAGDRRVLIETVLAQDDASDLEAGMLSIVRRARAPVLFVTHAAVVDPDGRLIHARQRLGQWAADIAARHGMALLDPTPLVEAFGIERAFDEAGRSRSHYAESFEAELADQLLARLRELAASGEAFPPAAAAIPHRSWPASPDPSTTRPASLASLRSGDLAGAAAASRLALAADPASGGALTTLAQVALRDNRSEIGLALVDLALESDPGDVGALSTRAKLLTRLKRFGEAATAWVALADRRAGAAWPFAEAARCALRAEDPGRALTLAEQGLALEPDDAVGLAIKAEALHRLGRLSELAPVGIALARQSPEAVAAVLHWLTDAGDVAGIVSVVTAVSGHLGEIAPELVRTLWTHAREADLHGRWIDLAGCLRAISLLEPNGRDAPAELQRLRRRWQVHAREALKGGRDQHAADAFDLLLAIEPEDRSATREAASLHSRLGHAQRAADLWTILCSEEADPRTLMRAARSNEVAGRDLPALALYRRALDAGSDDEKTRIYYESLTRRLSKRARMLADEAPDQATDLARKILEIVPDQAACLRILKKRISQLSADLKGAAKDGEERVRIAERLIELDPDKPDALRAIASARYSERRLPEALAHMQRLVRIQGGVAAHWIKLGRCLTKLKRYDEARSATEHALTLAPDSEAARRVMAALDSCTAA